MDIKIQLLPLFGVVVGAVMTFLSSNLIERSRWERQQSIRWDERRLDAYVRYAAAIKRNLTAVAQVLAGKGVIKTINPVGDEVGQLELAAAEAERSTAFEAVLMLGDTATIEAGSQLNREVWRMQAYARGELPINAATRGINLFHSLTTTWKSVASCARPTPSNRSTPATVGRYEPVVTSLPSRQH